MSGAPIAVNGVQLSAALCAAETLGKRGREIPRVNQVFHSLFSAATGRNWDKSQFSVLGHRTAPHHVLPSGQFTKAIVWIG